MESLNAIALTYLRPALPLTLLKDLYDAVGSATEIMENRMNIRDVLPDMAEQYVHTFSGDISEALKSAENELKFCEKHEIKVLTPDAPEYPHRLNDCNDAPIALYYRGNADLNARHIVCIIGTRKCTTYGQDIIRRFVRELKELCPDALIISGLAYGVDIHAHRNALEQGMETVGVLAHGLDMIYPQTHRETAKKMLRQGGILTEYPSKSRIDKRNFLQRNRIVAGMSDACILPESASHGGGLVTCRLSMEYGREVFAFPGPVNAEFSKGCNEIIRRNGAQLITSAADFVADMGWENETILAEAQARGIERAMFQVLSPDEQRIADALKQHGDLQLDQLVVITSMPMAVVKSTLFIMEMNGIVKALAGGVYHIFD